ncbi:leucine-rich repeat protein [[Clostridium] fimetarium]|uniref:Leucine rich repeat-containing protein n=1 Tax=[Clostridium] fimetarium TaxID=99656 RepID=A0A1I0PFX5_9FIRM|nr:leucine-rich repeat protein [[Clostridium] fimetarium]SEW12547.1 Leucine rich repeat-containing protein [[Clostridium] fimetarium]
MNNIKRKIIKLCSFVTIITIITGNIFVFGEETLCFAQDSTLTSTDVTTVTVDSIIYELSNSTAKVVGYEGNIVNVTIPSKVNNYTVISISGKAFLNCITLQSIILPDTITTIEDGYYDYTTWSYAGAFTNCSSLTSVTFSANLTEIGEWTFSDCKLLANVKLPNSLKIISLSAFENCSAITEITIPEGVTDIEQNAFSGASLKSIYIPESVKILSMFAFDCSTIESYNFSENNQYYKSINGVWLSKDGSRLYNYPTSKKDTIYTIPSTVQVIASGAFSRNNYIEVLNMPASVNSIGSAAFQKSHIKKFNVDSNNSIFTSKDGVIYSKDKSILIAYPAYKSDKVFYIPTTVTKIGSVGDYSFETCNYLEEVIIPDSVSEINGIFWMSSALKNVSISKVSKISKLNCLTFQNCAALRDFYVPDNVSFLGFNLFYGCNNLSTVVFGKNSCMNAGTMDLQYSNQTAFCGASSNLTVYAYGSDNNIKKALTAYDPYVKYVDLEKTSKVIFAPNGAEGSISVNNVISGQKYVLPDNTYHKEGFSFIGWSDGTTVCNPGDTYTMPETGGIIFTAEWSKIVKLGDVTLDDEIDIFDILAIQRHIVGTLVLTEKSKVVADVTGNSSVDIFDILVIQRHILGVESIK